MSEQTQGGTSRREGLEKLSTNPEVKHKDRMSLRIGHPKKGYPIQVTAKARVVKIRDRPRAVINLRNRKEGVFEDVQYIIGDRAYRLSDPEHADIGLFSESTRDTERDTLWVESPRGSLITPYLPDNREKPLMLMVTKVPKSHFVRPKSHHGPLTDHQRTALQPISDAEMLEAREGVPITPQQLAESQDAARRAEKLARLGAGTLFLI